MSRVTFREPTRFDVGFIGARMAKIDRLECAVYGRSPTEALALAMDASVLCWTGCMNGLPQAMFGVTPVSLLTGWGRPWFLGTDKARKAQREFLTMAPDFLARIEVIFPKLDNYVHQSNGAAIRWLRRLGFVVETELQDHGGEPMLRFYKGG